jgi:flagellar hook-associated protein 1 FlgK
MSQLSSNGILDGGRTSLTAGNGALVAQAGGIAQQASLRKEAQEAIQAQTQSELDSVSGVNLDEEAADLVRFQQAYQAAARVIAVADTVFQALLQAARG